MNGTSKVIEKMKAEFNQYQTETMKLSKEDIFDKAYEISTKLDIVGFFESNRQLTTKQIEILFSVQNTLDFLYDCWLILDVSKADDIIECLWIACSLIS